MVHCRSESSINQLLQYRRNKEYHAKRLSKSGITSDVLNEATAAFISTVIQEMGPKAQKLCLKDSTYFQFLDVLNDVFPRSKFILMVRDPRAAVASIIRQDIKRGQVSQNITTTILEYDEIAVQMLEDCQYIGKHRCLFIRYECLVLNSRSEIQKVLGK
uniref:Protein-tyrosine sulfotransferase n=1 Tax=Trichobilharzia regenti TaxID=157069 RepID=A0AA85K2G9_TRIRE|nr:unnamed protein product [Trichobilharzia regenti]